MDPPPRLSSKLTISHTSRPTHTPPIQNRAEGILSIVSKSHSTDPADPFHTLRLAKRVQCPTLLLGGKGDVVAAAPEIERLAAEAGKGWPVHLIPNTGHNAVFEDPATWRRHVLEFLSSA